MGTTSVCSDSADLLFVGGGPGAGSAGDAVIGFSRSGEDAGFAALLSTKGACDLGSCLDVAVRMEGLSSGYLGGKDTVLGFGFGCGFGFADGKRNGRVNEAWTGDWTGLALDPGMPEVLG